MTDQPWLSMIIEAFGEPSIQPVDPATYTGRSKVTEDGVWLGGFEGSEGKHRRAWVWFPTVGSSSKNHFFRIDRYSSRWETTAGSHVPWKPLVELVTSEPPTNDQIYQILHLAKFLWSEPDEDTQRNMRMLGRPTLNLQRWVDP